MKRVVIKVGSNVLTRSDGALYTTRISSVVDQVEYIRREGCEVILVTSGAVACGRSIIGEQLKSNASKKMDEVSRRQLFSAVGQARLISIYSQLFRDWGTSVGQILTMKESFSTREEYLNQRSCMEVMLKNGVVPIVNENDTVSITGLMFTDNDELSGLTASMMDADTLIILSNIDGIYDGNPSLPESRLITKVAPSDDLSGYIAANKSKFGRGGMNTKYSIARKVSSEGIRVIIANGGRENIIKDIYLGTPGISYTEFIPSERNVSSVKKWINHSDTFTKGAVIVDESVEKILRSEATVSLLPVGVLSVEGDFEEGDIITIKNASGCEIAIGKSSFNSTAAREFAGKHDCRPLVHYDYLCLL